MHISRSPRLRQRCHQTVDGRAMVGVRVGALRQTIVVVVAAAAVAVSCAEAQPGPRRRAPALHLPIGSAPRRYASARRQDLSPQRAVVRIREFRPVVTEERTDARYHYGSTAVVMML